MKNRDKENKEKQGFYTEDTTQYGEMVPTNFGWVSPEEQKRKANCLANLGKEKHKK